jgi:hypothetical protein
MRKVYKTNKSIYQMKYLIFLIMIVMISGVTALQITNDNSNLPKVIITSPGNVSNIFINATNVTNYLTNNSYIPFNDAQNNTNLNNKNLTNIDYLDTNILATDNIIVNTSSFLFQNINTSSSTSGKMVMLSQYQARAGNAYSNVGNYIKSYTNLSGSTCTMSSDIVGTQYDSIMILPTYRTGFTGGNQYTGIRENIYINGSGEAGSVPVLNGKETNVYIGGNVDYQYGININPIKTTANLKDFSELSTNFLGSYIEANSIGSQVGNLQGLALRVTNGGNASQVHILDIGYSDQYNTRVGNDVIGIYNYLTTSGGFTGGSAMGEKITVANSLQAGNATGTHYYVAGNNASNGQYAINIEYGDINQDNGNSTITLIYGEMYNKSDTGFYNVDLTTVDTYYQVKNLTAGLNNGFKVTSGNLTAQKKGVYRVIAKAGVIVVSGAGGDNGMKLFINEVGQDKCYDHEHTSGNPIGFIFSCLVSINRNDNVSIRFDDHASPVSDLTVLNANINLERIGN